MKKYILTLLCVFLGYSAVYASFPVTQNTVVEHIEIEELTKTPPISDPTPLANWSFALGLLWAPFLLLGAIFALEGPEENALFFLVSGVASFIGAIITGVMSLSRKEGSAWKAIIGLSLTAGIILLSILSAGLDGFY